MPTTTRSQGAAFWQSHVEACAQRRLSATAYARLHGLAVSTFLRWQRKLATPAIVPLQLLAADMPPSAPAIVVQYGDCRLHLSETVPPAWLAQLLRSLT